MGSCVRTVFIIAAAAVMFGCDETRDLARNLPDLIAREIPIGSERSAVVAFLHRHGLRDATAAVRPPRASFVDDRSRNYIVAVVRNVEQTAVTRTDLRIDFSFDDRNRLIGYKTEKMLTGP